MSTNETHPAWKVAAGLAILFFMTVAIGTVGLSRQNKNINDIQNLVIEAEELSNINRSLNCSDIINDGEMEVVDVCLDSGVVIHYPPAVCKKLSPPIENCGREALINQGD